MMNYVERAVSAWNIPESLTAAPVDKEWKSTPAHVGPHSYTPLRKSLEFKTSAALLSLIAGSMVWGHVRLRAFTDTTVLTQLAEALCCYQIDPLYLNPQERFRYIPLTQGMALPEAAVRVYPWIFFEVFFMFPRFWPVYPPIIETARAIHLTRDIMPKRERSFDKWAESAIARLNVIAAFPDIRMEPIPPGSPPDVWEAESRRAIGQPLGPSALAGDGPLDEAANRAELADILAAAEAAGNPLLRAPDAMRAEGFKGIPYRLPELPR